MCRDCYERFGSPHVINDAVKDAAEKIRAVFAFSDVGGNLHCEIDDWNVEDRFFEDEFKPFTEVPVAQAEAEQKCYAALKALPFAERVSALALHDGYIDAT